MKDLQEQIIDLAVKEMHELRHPYLDSSHLLLALLKTDDSKDFLESYGVTYDSVYSTIIDLVGKGECVVSNDVSNTPALDRILSKYKKHMKKSKNHINSALLLLMSMLESDEGIGIRILISLDVDLDEMYNDLELTVNDSIDKLLNKYACLIDLNKAVSDDKIVITGLDDELKQLCKYLLKLQKPNVIILGEPGVGKTALVEKLAAAINDKKVPKFLQNLRIIQLSLGNAIAGTKYRGEFEEKISGIIDAVSKKNNIILFVDEIHMMVGAGGAEGAIDASNLFKPALARGKVRMIGATTNSEYKEYICSDKAFARRFNTIELLETTEEETMNILSKAKVKLEKHYGIKLTNNDLVKVYKDSTHRSGRMPDVALDALEEYCVDLYYNKETDKEEVNV